MNAAGSIAKAVFVPMQWLISVTGSSCDAELPLHQPRRRLLERGDAVVGVAAVLGLVDLLGHDAADRLGGHLVVLADAEVDQPPLGMLGQGLPLGPLDLLELVDFGAFAVVGCRRCGRQIAAENRGRSWGVPGKRAGMGSKSVV